MTRLVSEEKKTWLEPKILDLARISSPTARVAAKSCRIAWEIYCNPKG